MSDKCICGHLISDHFRPTNCTYCQHCTCGEVNPKPDKETGMAKYKLFVHVWCSCGVSAQIPVNNGYEEKDINQTLLDAGWLLNPLRCNKCRERSETDPQEKL